MTEIYNLLHTVFCMDVDFYVKLVFVDIFVVFGLTFVSNHLIRWRVVKWNLQNPHSPVFFDVKDSISGFEVKTVLRPKEESATIKNTSVLIKKEANP